MFSLCSVLILKCQLFPDNQISPWKWEIRLKRATATRRLNSSRLILIKPKVLFYLDAVITTPKRESFVWKILSESVFWTFLEWGHVTIRFTGGDDLPYVPLTGSNEGRCLIKCFQFPPWKSVLGRIYSHFLCFSKKKKQCMIQKVKNRLQLRKCNISILECRSEGGARGAAGTGRVKCYLHKNVLFLTLNLSSFTSTSSSRSSRRVFLFSVGGGWKNRSARTKCSVEAEFMSL